MGMTKMSPPWIRVGLIRCPVSSAEEGSWNTDTQGECLTTERLWEEGGVEAEAETGLCCHRPRNAWAPRSWQNLQREKDPADTPSFWTSSLLNVRE